MNQLPLFDGLPAPVTVPRSRGRAAKVDTLVEQTLATIPPGQERAFMQRLTARTIQQQLDRLPRQDRQAVVLLLVEKNMGEQ